MREKRELRRTAREGEHHQHQELVAGTRKRRTQEEGQGRSRIRRPSPDLVGRPTQLIYISDIYFLFVDDQHRSTNMNDKDHLVGQLTSENPK